MSYIIKQPQPTGVIQVVLATNHYIPALKSQRQSRYYLGMLDQETNELILGANKEEPSEEILGLLALKGISYTGRRSSRGGRKKKHPDADEAILQIEETTKPSTVTEVGRVSALQHLSDECGLSGALDSTFEQPVAERLLAAAMFLACDGGPHYLADAWADDVGINTMSAATVSRLCTEVGGNDTGRDQFFQSWIKACGNPRSLVHDTTSISTYSRFLEDAEWGYNRDNEKLQQINLALVVGRETRLPLWYRQIPGSIPDVATLKLTCQHLMALGLNEFNCSLDRGYFSQSNVSEMLEENLGFTIGVPFSSKQAKQIVQKHRNALNNQETSFSCDGKNMRHIACRYKIKVKSGDVRDLPAHLFLDPMRASAVADRIETTLNEIVLRASGKVYVSKEQVLDWIQDNGGKFASYLQAQGTESSWRVQRNSAEIEKLIARSGLTLVLTTVEGQSPAEVLSDYRCRDIAEKFFDIEKNDVGADRLRTGNSERVKGRLFITFLALILRGSLEKKLRERNLLKKYTVNETLEYLRKIRSITLADGRTLNCEVSKKTREIAEAIGLKLNQ